MSKGPRLMPEVMQAIADLKEANGSTQNKIIEHIQSIVAAKKIIPKPRNVTVQVKKALKHGVLNGLIRQRAGKYRLGLQRKDFDVFKSIRSFGPRYACNKCKKSKKGRRGTRSRRRRRRRRLGARDSLELKANASDDDEPADRGRRRGKRRRRRRRRGKRYAEKQDSNTSNRSNVNTPRHKSSKCSNDACKQKTSDNQKRKDDDQEHCEAGTTGSVKESCNRYSEDNIREPYLN